MLAIHYRNFRIRSSECDANGHLHSSHYLRFMQESAFDALAKAGYDLENHQNLEYIWLIHETYVQFRKPIYYNHKIKVKTWLADLRKLSTRRIYEFNSWKDNQLLADGWSDWVYIDVNTKKPTRIPSNYGQVFFPNGVPYQSPSRRLMHQQASFPQETFSIRYIVTFDDLDVMQHVNNARYMDLVNLCGFKAIERFGWSWKKLIDYGFTIYLYDFHIKYFQPAFLDDELEIITWLANVKRSTVTRHFIVKRVHDNATIVRVNARSVWINNQTNQAVRIPEQIIRDFSPNISR
jgi:acyl-CoA thioester hydrolase